MNQFRALLHAQMASVGLRMTGGNTKWKKKSKKNTKRGTIGFAILWGFIGVMFMMMFGSIFFAIAEAFAAMNLGWLYMTIQFLLCMLFMLIGTVFLAKVQLFEAKDNLLLLAMPIKSSVILSVRMLSLYLMNLLWGSVILIPALVCWFVFNGFSLSILLIDLLLFLAVGLLTLSISCLLGWAISRISAHIRNKTFITVFVYIAFIAVYYYFCGTGTAKLMMLLTEQSELVAKTLGMVAPLYWMGDAVSNGNLISLLWVLAICVLPFALVYGLLAKTFISTVTASHGFKKVRYEAQKAKTETPAAALLQRENARFLSSAVYLLNAGLGLVFLIAAAIMMLFKKNMLISFFTMMGWDLMSAAVCGISCMMLSMVIITAPSVSLEAKTLWQLRSMPVRAIDILKAKWKLQIFWSAIPLMLVSIVGVIFLFSGGADSAMLMAELELPAEALEEIAGTQLTTLDYVLDAAALLLLPQLFSVLTSGLGLLFGLKYVNLNWTNEAQVIKQGSAVLCSMFGSMLLLVVPALTIYFGRSILPVSVLLIIWTVLFAAAVIGVSRLVRVWGTKTFESLPA